MKVPDIDLLDAIVYFFENTQEFNKNEQIISQIIKLRGCVESGEELDLSEFKTTLIQVNLEDPADLIDISAFMRKPRGWLKKHDQDQWADLMEQEIGRDYSYIVSKKISNTTSPAIRINGEFGDGRGRCLLYYSLGENIPVAYYKIKI